MAETKKMRDALLRVSEAIDEASGPDEMTPQEALDFYESLVSDIEAKIEGIKCDLAING